VYTGEIGSYSSGACQSEPRMSTRPPGTAFDFDNSASLLQCPICIDLLSPGPIQQCRNGHSVCASHIRQLSTCPICRVSYREGSSRNLVAENFVARERARVARQQELERAVLEGQSQQRTSTGNIRNGSGQTSATANQTNNVIPMTRSHTNLPHNNNNLIPCTYIEAGCPFESVLNSTRQHEINCHFR